ncbi:hypothetical protein Taro_040945 [Colocasia esculenta]|uniref:Uncharacterized protein n=1 Tax=Colocasia esculenta TaxID=4460 RepID=A0A843WZG7_COLES|nr:hypothetical protein [Colocasia esculenta]
MDKPTSTPLVRWIFLALDGELKQKTGEPSSSCSWLRLRLSTADLLLSTGANRFAKTRRLAFRETISYVYLSTGYSASVDRCDPSDSSERKEPLELP